MTHTGPMKESEGKFTQLGVEVRPCARCRQPTRHHAVQWDSNCGGYEDFKYTCLNCGAVHWVDGIDS